MRRDRVVGGVRSAGVGDRRTLIDIDRSHRERERGLRQFEFRAFLSTQPGCQAIW